MRSFPANVAIAKIAHYMQFSCPRSCSPIIVLSVLLWISQYRQLQALSPHEPRGYLGLGSILSKYGQNDEAIQQLQHAHSLNPENFEANMALGRLLAKTGKFDESIPSLEEASREQPNSPEAHYQLALSLQRAGRAEQASHEFAEVERLNQQRRSGSEMPKP